MILLHLYALLLQQEIILRFAGRRRRRQRQFQSPFAESWFEVHYYDHTIPKDFIFRKQLRMHFIAFSRFLLAFPKRIAVHKIPLINAQLTLLHVMDFCFLGGDIGKICLPHQYTSASQPRFQGPPLPVPSLANKVVGIFDLFSPICCIFSLVREKIY